MASSRVAPVLHSHARSFNVKRIISELRNINLAVTVITSYLFGVWPSACHLHRKLCWCTRRRLTHDDGEDSRRGHERVSHRIWRTTGRRSSAALLVLFLGVAFTFQEDFMRRYIHGVALFAAGMIAALFF